MAIKRLNYFNGQFLRETDFDTEQNYHQLMRRSHNRRAHSPGIVDGLEVVGGTSQVTASVGMALDQNGREIILDADTSVAVNTGHVNAYIVIALDETETDSSVETGITGFTRWTESAVLEVVSTVPASAVGLAQISAVAGDGTVTLNSAYRRIYSAPVVEGDLTVRRDLIVEGTISGNIAVGSVEATDLVNNAVTSAKLREADGTSAQNTNTGSGVKTNHIQNDAITAAKIAPNAVTAAKIAPNAVAASEIAAGAVGNSELANNAVNAAKIANGTVGTAELANGAVSQAKLDSSTNQKINNALAGASQWSDAAGGVIHYNSGNVGIGTTSPGAKLEVNWNATSNINPIAIIETTGTNSAAAMRFQNANSQNFNVGITSTGEFAISENSKNISLGGDYLRITKTGNVGIGTLSPSGRLDVRGSLPNNYIGQFRNQISGTGAAYGLYAEGASTNATNQGRGAQFIGRGSTGGGGAYGSLSYAYAYGSQNAHAVYANATGGTTTGKEYAFYGVGDSYFQGNVGIGVTNAGADKLDVRGRCYSSGGWQTTNADYAEYFESDRKSNIPIGTSVTLTPKGSIRPSKKGDIPIGIVATNSAIVGNSFKEWPKKHLRDDFGNAIMEEYQQEIMIPKKEKVTRERQKMAKKTIEEEVSRIEIVLVRNKYRQKEVTETITREIEEPVFKKVDLYDAKGKNKIGKHNVPVMETFEEEFDVLDEEGLPELVGTGKFTKAERPKLNPDYDESKEYISREHRPEWNCVGLLGQLALRKGQQVAPTWVKIKDISDDVELWLVK